MTDLPFTPQTIGRTSGRAPRRFSKAPLHGSGGSQGARLRRRSAFCRSSPPNDPTNYHPHIMQRRQGQNPRSGPRLAPSNLADV